MDLMPSSEPAKPEPAKPSIIGITDYTVIYSDGATAKVSLKTPIPVNSPVKPFSNGTSLSDGPKGSSSASKPFSI